MSDNGQAQMRQGLIEWEKRMKPKTEVASTLTADDIAKLRAHWNDGGRLSDWQVARLLDIASGEALGDAMGINDDALNEAGWELLRCAGPAIHPNRCKDVAREVLKAYINSLHRTDRSVTQEKP